MFEVDLHAPSIPNDRRIWRLFPGQHYRFLEQFQAEGKGFLDIPGFQMPEGPLSSADDLLSRLSASQATHEALIARPQVAPLLLDPQEFKGAKNTQARGRLRQAIVNLYGEAKTHDLVVLPSPIYMSEIFIGTFENDLIFNSIYPKRYGETPIPSRAIKWIARTKENSVSTQLSEALRTQHPFTVLENSLYIEVLSLAYSSFIYKGRHVSTIYNRLGDYLDSDSAFLGNISRLAAAACRSIEEGQKGLGKETLLEIFLRTPPIEFTCSQDIYIRSPGFNRFVSGTIVSLVIAAFVAAIIGFSELGTKEAVATATQQIQVVNSSPSADKIFNLPVSDATSRILHSLDIDTTWNMCQEIKAARIRNGIESSAKPPAAKQRHH